MGSECNSSERAFDAQSQKTAKLKALRLARDAEEETTAAQTKAAATAAKAATRKKTPAPR